MLKVVFTYDKNFDPCDSLGDFQRKIVGLQDHFDFEYKTIHLPFAKSKIQVFEYDNVNEIFSTGGMRLDLLSNFLKDHKWT